jgi:2-polyprenyl-3-methyl-5-hydroxy-6-metoxy-1,4-benzoquinol methylase
LDENVRLIYKEQVSKKTRRINTSGLFFCLLILLTIIELTIKMTSKIDPSSDVFNNFYSQEDPWGIIESIPNLARQEILNSKFQNCQFQNGLDLGCGEGNLTVSMKFVNNFDAIDISKVALSRAKKNILKLIFKNWI